MKTKNLSKNNVKNVAKANSNVKFVMLDSASLKKISGGYKYAPSIPINKPKD